MPARATRTQTAGSSFSLTDYLLCHAFHIAAHKAIAQRNEFPVGLEPAILRRLIQEKDGHDDQVAVREDLGDAERAACQLLFRDRLARETLIGEAGQLGVAVRAGQLFKASHDDLLVRGVVREVGSLGLQAGKGIGPGVRVHHPVPLHHGDAPGPAARAHLAPGLRRRRKPVRLIVPYPAGGATDFFARTVFTKMSESLGQQVVVENRPGAGTAIGASEVARSTPDGYTLLLGDAGTYAFNPTLYRKLSYDPMKDFAPVSLTGRFALILAVNPAVQTASVKEFVAAAKRSPGAIDYGAPGPGSPIHLAMEFFKQRADIIMTPIPYKGGADAMTDLIGGRISAMFPDIASALPQIRGGKLRALAVASDKRVAALPELPTLGESGYPGFEAWAWQGFVAPAGPSRPGVMKLHPEGRTSAKRRAGGRCSRCRARC